MSLPTQPTETSIIEKAYRLYRNSSPTSAETTYAQDAVASVKSDLMNEGREWGFLREHTYVTPEIYVPHIQVPTDYSKLIQATVLDGTRRGTAQAGGSSTITLDSTDSATSDSTESKYVVLTGGTGEGQGRIIKDFNSTTKVVTVADAWATTPDNTSTYLIVDEQRDLELKQIWEYDELSMPHLRDLPMSIYHQADDAEGDFYLDYAPDQLYPIRIRYYSDLRKMDTDTGTNPRYARILRLLEQLFVQGIFIWLLQDDTRYVTEVQKYVAMLARASGEFLYPNNASQHADLAEGLY